MFNELSLPVTVKAMAFGHPFEEARRLANAIMLQVVLLCTLLGYRMVRTGEDGWREERAFFQACRYASPGICGIFPVIAGTGAGITSRTLLHQ